MLQQLLSTADPSIFHLLERVAVGSFIKLTCECNYEPIRSAPAFRARVPPQPISQILFLIFPRVWFQDYSTCRNVYKWVNTNKGLQY